MRANFTRVRWSGISPERRPMKLTLTTLILLGLTACFDFSDVSDGTCRPASFKCPANNCVPICQDASPNPNEECAAQDTPTRTCAWQANDAGSGLCLCYTKS